MSLADSVQAVSDMRLAVRDTVAEDLGLQEPLSEDHVEALQMQRRTTSPNYRAGTRTGVSAGAHSSG